MVGPREGGIAHVGTQLAYHRAQLEPLLVQELEELAGEQPIGIAVGGAERIGGLLANAGGIDDERPARRVCTKNVSDVMNDALAAASDAVEAAEKVFAAANTDQDARLTAANMAQVAVAALTEALKKYGVSRFRAG